MKLTVLPILLLAVQGAYANENLSVICMTAPVTPLYPGLAVNAKLDSQGKRCEATLTFSNPDFFPVRFDFQPMQCQGYQEAEFLVPQEVPNGDAFIFWRCADQKSPTCTKANITGGSEDASSIEFSQSGVISCILPIATQTTLMTIVEPSTTFTRTAISTILSTSVLSTAHSADSTATTLSASISSEVQTVVSTMIDGTHTAVTTLTSTSSSMPFPTASNSPDVGTVVSTTIDGTHTAVTTFVSPASMTGNVPTTTTGTSPEVEVLITTSINGTRSTIATLTTTLLTTDTSAPLITSTSVTSPATTLTMTKACKD